MKRIAWATDIHLNFLADRQACEFYEHIAQQNIDAFLIAGDIAESTDFARHLQDMQTILARPVYFVLGNHDYYHSSIDQVRAETRTLCKRNPNLIWLSDADTISLNKRTALVGHDGWSDGRLGDYRNSTILLNDYVLIEELAYKDKRVRLEILNGLGDEAADHFRRVLPQTLDKFEHVIVLTHVPPFLDACWHEGKISDDNWAPHFSCKAVGDVLQHVARQYPNRRLQVLCGHTHGSGEVEISPNLHVTTGGAQYGEPAVQQIITVD